MGRFLLKAIFFLAGLVISLNGLGCLAERFAPVNLWRNVSEQQYASLMVRREKIRAMKEARPNLQNLSIEALARTIEYLQEKDIRVVLFTPPYYQAYTVNFTDQAPEVFAHMHQALNRLKRQYQVEYYDFSSDPQLIGQHELFLNSDHLNDCGRKAFSKQLLNTMVENAHKHRIFHQEKS